MESGFEANDLNNALPRQESKQVLDFESSIGPSLKSEINLYLYL